MRSGNSRIKHVDLKIKWIQDHLQKGDIQIHHVPTSLNMTDILTKASPRETFVRCIPNALNPDDILPTTAQNEVECWENIWWILNTYSLYERISYTHFTSIMRTNTNWYLNRRAYVTHMTWASGYDMSHFICLSPSPYRRQGYVYCILLYHSWLYHLEGPKT